MAAFDRVFGPYLLGPRLGAGSGGTVNLAVARARDAPLPRPVVVKRLAPQAEQDAHFEARFRHEAEVAVLARSPHLPEVYELGRVEDVPYIAMEFIPGVAASRLTADVLETQRPLSFDVARRLLRSVLLGLEDLHDLRDPRTGQPTGFVHRDLAPKNVMLTPDHHVRIIDLGIGRSSLQGFKTQTGMVLGTPGYLAPEQVLGGAVDARTDLYAAAIILYEWITAERVVSRRGSLMQVLKASERPRWSPPRDLNPTLPRGVDELMSVLLHPEPQHRLPSAAHVLAALDALASDGGGDEGRLDEVLAAYRAPELPPLPSLGDAPELALGTEVFARRASTTVRAPRSETSRPRAEPARPKVWLVAVAATALGLSAAAGLLAGGPRPGAPEPTARQEPAGAPSVTPRDVEAPRVTPQPEEPEDPVPAPPPPPDLHPPKAAPARDRAPPAEAPPATERDPAEVGAQLLERVRSLQARLPPGRQGDLRALRADIERDRTVRSNRSAALRRLAQHRATLDAIEATAP